MTTELITIPEIQGIELAIAQPIIDAFLPHFNAAQALAEKSKGINVTDPTDIDGIRAAREARLALRAERVAANKVRESKKEVYLRMGKAIQGIYNRIDGITAPEEARLQGMEDIAERLQAERKRKLGDDRKAALAPFLAPGSAFSGLEDMSPQSFVDLLGRMKAAHAQRLKDAEAERDRQLAEAYRQQELADENARLEKEAEAARKALAAERMAAMKERQRLADLQAADNAKRAAEAAADRAALEEKARNERAAAEAIARAERQARQKAEAELAAKKAEEAAEAKRVAAAKAKAEAAPDVEKVKAYIAALLAVPTPAVKNAACVEAVGNLVADLNYYMEGAEKL